MSNFAVGYFRARVLYVENYKKEKSGVEDGSMRSGTMTCTFTKDNKDNLSTNLYTYSAEVIMTYKEDKTLVSLVKNIKGKFSFFGDYLNFKNQYLNNSSYIFYDTII